MRYWVERAPFPALYVRVWPKKRWRGGAQAEFSDLEVQFKYQRTPKFNRAKKYINTGKFLLISKKGIFLLLPLMIRAILSGGRYMIDIDKEGALISHPKTRGASIKPDAGDEPCHAPAHFIARLNLWSQSGDLRQPLGPANVLQ